MNTVYATQSHDIQTFGLLEAAKRQPQSREPAHLWKPLCRTGSPGCQSSQAAKHL